MEGRLRRATATLSLCGRQGRVARGGKRSEDGRRRDGETLAYVCRRFVCDAPVSTAEALRAAL